MLSLARMTGAPDILRSTPGAMILARYNESLRSPPISHEPVVLDAIRAASSRASASLAAPATTTTSFGLTSSESANSAGGVAQAAPSISTRARSITVSARRTLPSITGPVSARPRLSRSVTARSSARSAAAENARSAATDAATTSAPAACATCAAVSTQPGATSQQVPTVAPPSSSTWPMKPGPRASGESEFIPRSLRRGRGRHPPLLRPWHSRRRHPRRPRRRRRPRRSWRPCR